MVGKTDIKTQPGAGGVRLDPTVTDVGSDQATPKRQTLVAPDTTQAVISEGQPATQSRTGAASMLDARVQTNSRRTRGKRQKNLAPDTKPMSRMAHGAVRTALEDVRQDLAVFRAEVSS